MMGTFLYNGSNLRLIFSNGSTTVDDLFILAMATSGKPSTSTIHRRVTSNGKPPVISTAVLKITLEGQTS